MKRFLKSAWLLLLTLALVSCGEYFTPLENPTQQGNGEGAGPGSSEHPEDDPNAFTVSIRYNGEQYIPRKSAKMQAQWTDGYSVYTADFATDGFARVSGLDGDYRVTLKGLPEGYLYNPNTQIATNDQRNIVIDIYKPIRTSGRGLDKWDCIEISKTGVYRVELTSASHEVFFQYAPDTSGTYSVESWMSTAEGNYNPMCDVYTGTIGYKSLAYTLDNGGYCDGYTQNFKHIVEIADEQISKDGGQAVFTFAVHADSKNGEYPVYLDIAIQLNGSFELGGGKSQLIVPTEEFKQTPNYDPARYTWTWAETETVGVEGRYEFDGSMFKLFEKDEDINGDGVGDGDGYYHVYDETLYAGNGGYGPILYACITEPCRFMDLSFTHVEDPGNKALTVNGTDNYKLFIEGNQIEAGYFCVSHDQNNVYCPCIGTNCNGICYEGCEECHEQCRQLPTDYGSIVGYADYVNSDGVYAVTEELKVFLQAFSISQRYFADGNGWVEEHPLYKVDAKEEDQWLFACGYYVEK